jgi:hypothetical protein
VAAALERPDHPELLCRYVALRFCCAVEQLGMCSALLLVINVSTCATTHGSIIKPVVDLTRQCFLLRVCIYLTLFSHHFPHPSGVLPTRTVQAATIPAAWHVYIAANLHFYTSLLACFVK